MRSDYPLPKVECPELPSRRDAQLLAGSTEKVRLISWVLKNDFRPPPERAEFTAGNLCVPGHPAGLGHSFRVEAIRRFRLKRRSSTLPARLGSAGATVSSFGGPRKVQLPMSDVTRILLQVEQGDLQGLRNSCRWSATNLDAGSGEARPREVAAALGKSDGV